MSEELRVKSEELLYQRQKINDKRLKANSGYAGEGFAFEVF